MGSDNPKSISAARMESTINGVPDCPPGGNEKDDFETIHTEETATCAGNLIHDDDNQEPELHLRTYIALAAMFFLNVVQTIALQGPSAVVCMVASPPFSMQI